MVPSPERFNLASSFRVAAAQAAQGNGMVGGVIDNTGQIHFTPLIAGKVVGHQGAIEQGLLPANPRTAFSVFVDSKGTPVGVHWKSAYNSVETDFLPPAPVRQQIMDSIPDKSSDFFQSGLD